MYTSYEELLSNSQTPWPTQVGTREGDPVGHEACAREGARDARSE